MNTEEIMKLADAYAGRFGAYRLSQTGLTLSEYQQARAALEAALTAKQEAVAVFDEQLGRPCLVEGAPMLEHGQPLYTHPAPEAKQEPVAHSVIAGALFDFMGWLTSRKERLVLSGADDASPAVEVIKQFAEMRGLSLADAQVQEWQEHIATEAALSAKQGEQALQDVSDPAPSVNAQNPTNVGALALNWYDQTMEDEGVITRDALHMFALSLPVSPAPSVSAQESEIVLSRESFLMMGQRIAELEDELHEQARVNGMGSEREATLMAKVEQLLEALTGYHSNSTKEDWPVGVWLAAEDTIAKIKGVLG